MDQTIRASAWRSVVLAVTVWGGLLVPLVGSAAWAQSGEGLTPLQVARIEMVTGAVISDDGRHVAYTVAVPADPLERNDPSTVQLHVLDRQTGESRALFTEASVAGVAFRPGHGTISFIAAVAEDEPRSVYEVAVTGGTPSRVWGFDRPVLGYSWSPDGNRLAFMANEHVEDPATPLPYQPEFYEENLAQRLGYVVDVTRAEQPREIRYEGSYYLMEWSPQGDRLAVSVAPTSRIDDFYMFQAVKVVDAASLEVAAEIANEGKIAQVTWSPDGERLALRAGNDIHDPIDGRIMVASAAGGQPQNILPGFEGKFEGMAWTGQDEIQFIASEGVETSFGRIRPDGSGMDRIVARQGLAMLSFDPSASGAVAFVASTPSHPSEVYAFEPADGSVTRLTDRNPWLAEVPLSEQRVVRYPARDGAFEIEGLLILPIGYTEGVRVPVITMVHGGPEAHYQNGWLTNYSAPGQMAAARGYAVFYPNYRGSTGRGLTFIKSSQADAGGKEFDDIVDGIDYLIETGIADADRIGVTGGSYGGYATAWMSTYYSDRFAAGVMFVGISNTISKWGTSDIPQELYLVHSREWLWENNNWQKYLERSPIYYVDRAQTPLLILHGAEDTRVHPGQSLELYRHMAVRQPELPVRLILYPGEGHGNVRSASRLDYTMRMFGWFDSFLQGDGEKPSLDLELPAAVDAAAPVGPGR